MFEEGAERVQVHYGDGVAGSGKDAIDKSRARESAVRGYQNEREYSQNYQLGAVVDLREIVGRQQGSDCASDSKGVGGNSLLKDLRGVY